MVPVHVSTVRFHVSVPCTVECMQAGVQVGKRGILEWCVGGCHLQWWLCGGCGRVGQVG